VSGLKVASNKRTYRIRKEREREREREMRERERERERERGSKRAAGREWVDKKYNS